MPYSAARARWRAKLDFYGAAGVVLPEVHPINDEDWAAMQAEAQDEQALAPVVVPPGLRRLPLPIARPAPRQSLADLLVDDDAV